MHDWHIQMNNLSLRMKSYDAVGDDEPVFSDDEEERAYYETLKQKNSKDSSDGSVSRKRQRTSSEYFSSCVSIEYNWMTE